jgi:hypothetical protein
MYPMLQSKISQWYCTKESRKTQEPKSSTVAVPLLIWMLWPKDYWDHGKCKVRAWHDIQEWRQVVQHWSIIPRDGQSRKVTWELVPATTTLPCPPPELKLQGSCDGSAINMTTWLQWAQLECSKTLEAKKIRFQTCMCKIHKPVRWGSIHAFSLKCPKLWQCQQLMKKTRSRVHLHPGMQSSGGPVSQTIPQKLPCWQSIQF